MRAVVASFWLPRAGNRIEEYEDAFYPRRTGARAAKRMRFAVADGASESLLSGMWADLLVRTWCRSKRLRPGEVIATAMSGWQAEMRSYLERRDGQDRPIQWFEEPGLAKGAHATLVGLEMSTATPTSGRWAAVALGDSCVFQVRGTELLTSFPMKAATDFSTSPKLVPSRPHLLGRALANLDQAEGEWRSGDTFFLATDALAAWFLAEAEQGAAPWSTLAQFESETPELFAAWVGEQRGLSHLRNDDVTVVRVEVSGE
ncbi:MAG TPA: hypothetical protein VM142_03700 [Acidimicrobiales bacterium]|nr:hypothetical protein [Acidimicrobiales bacterium]